MWGGGWKFESAHSCPVLDLPLSPPDLCDSQCTPTWSCLPHWALSPSPSPPLLPVELLCSKNEVLFFSCRQGLEDKFVKQSCTDQGARVSEGLELRLFRITGDLWAKNSLSDPIGRRQKEEPAGPASLLRESVNPPVQTVCAPDKGCDRSCLPLRAWCLAPALCWR